jgi:hypothetical protein
VENHNPEVIIIDEIGRELEALAARTIAERGVQLIATAHGNTLDNLLLNPTLSDLVGGIESVTLSDEEARRRGTQKTILERRAPPTFDVLIEIQDRQRLLIHRRVTDSVDGLLRGRPPQAELRYRDANGEIQTEKADSVPAEGRNGGMFNARALSAARRPSKPQDPVHIFPYGIARNRLERAARRMQVPVYLVRNLGEAGVFITTKAFYRNRPRLVVDAERRGLPIYALRANTVAQMEAALIEIFDLEQPPDDALHQAMVEAGEAIRKVMGGMPEVELGPQNAFVRRKQHEMVRDADLISYSVGEEPNRRVRIKLE